MKHNTLLLSLLIALLIPISAFADLPGKHPYYLHALTALRDARWLIEHRQGDAKFMVSDNEALAIAKIDDTINEIKKAAIDDGKDIQDYTPIDVKLAGKGRLHRAEELLIDVHSAIAREEDDPKAIGLRDRAIHHLDEAGSAVHNAIINDPE